MINLFVDSIYKRHQTHVTGLNTDIVQIHQIIKVYRYYLLWGKSSLNYFKKIVLYDGKMRTGYSMRSRQAI